LRVSKQKKILPARGEDFHPIRVVEIAMRSVKLHGDSFLKGKIMNLFDERELDQINASGLCIVCKNGELISGPTGGSSQNFRCDKCGQEYNLGFNPFTPLVWIGSKLPHDESRKGFYRGDNLSNHPRFKENGSK
jgi:hypothetical protein